MATTNAARPPGTPDRLAIPTGEAFEDWTGDAIFYEYSEAADPLAVGSISPVPVHRFAATAHAGGPTRLVPLDLSSQLGVPYPATTPGLLASFMVIRADEHLTTRPGAASELYRCSEGDGVSSFECSDTLGTTTGSIRWSRGDVVALPAGCTTRHTAGAAGALLYRVDDTPLLRYLGVAPVERRFLPTRFDGAQARRRLAEVERDPEAARRSRVSLLLGTSATPQTLTVTHTLWAMIGVIPAGRVQRPHRHQSAAVDLISECSPGCYSLIGSRLDADGAILDPVRVDWESSGVFVTPPGLWHSHHNESDRPAYLVPVQDAGLHTYLRSLDIRFAPAG